MNRNFRLKQFNEFKRVRRYGKSYAHPLVVLVALQVSDGRSRVGVLAGRSLGSAVKRNRAKRMLREAIRPLLYDISPGWNIILISRKPILEASLPEIQAALRQLIAKANLISCKNGS